MPSEPEELWLADSDLPLKAQHIIDFTDSLSPSISDVAEGEQQRSLLDLCSERSRLIALFHSPCRSDIQVM